MRPDMFKVIVERPRKGKDSDRLANRLRKDLEGAGFLGTRAGLGYRSLNENLTPLRRYLESQVNRPWNKVYSDMREHIDSRSTVKQHILQHIEDFVAINTCMKGDEIWFVESTGWRGTPTPLKHARQTLYVNPRSGVLLPNKFAALAKAQRRERRNRAMATDGRRRVVSQSEQLIRLDGIWYHVTVATLPRMPVPSKPVRQWCAIRKALVSSDDAESFVGDKQRGSMWLFGAGHLYATSKRQLGKRELRKHGLTVGA